jgi:hypothetical protein
MMFSASHLKKICLALLMLGIVASAYGQLLAGSKLVEALQHGGYVIVMRHASSPQTEAAKGAANPDNPRDERQLDQRGISTATGHGNGNTIP